MNRASSRAGVTGTNRLPFVVPVSNAINNQASGTQPAYFANAEALYLALNTTKTDATIPPGVLSIVVGLTLRSGSVVTLSVALVTVVFFDRKARWEEAQLRERYPDYAEYASRTPRFVPGWPMH